MRVISTTWPNTKPKMMETRTAMAKRRLPSISSTALGADSRTTRARMVRMKNITGTGRVLLSLSRTANSCLLPGLAEAMATSRPLRNIRTGLIQYVAKGSCGVISAKGFPAVAMLAATMAVLA